jgi:hypothetical protein
MKKFLIVAIAISMSMFLVSPSFANDSNATAGGNVIGSPDTNLNANSYIHQDNSIHEASDLNQGRAFANPGNYQFGPVLNYFGQPLPSEGFQPVEQLLMYSDCFTEGALMEMLKGVEDAEAEMKLVTKKYDAANVAEDGETRWIKIVISRDKYASNDMKFIGFVTARSDNKKTTMTEVLAKAALSALKQGANVIHFTAQGAVRDAFSSGWGIGFNYTQARINDNKDAGHVGGGGFGYSRSNAGMRDLPWLQGFAIVDYSLTFPTIKVEDGK